MCIWWWKTTWVVLVPMATHIPRFVNVAHTELWIFYFFISQSEQICKWGIKYVHLVTTDHMGSTYAHHYPHTKFVAHTKFWIFDFLLLANQNRYANGVLNMRIWWRQTIWVVLVPITTHMPSFIKVAHIKLWIFDFFVISQSEQICKWGIKYAHSVTTDHMGTFCAHHYPHTKFH